MNEHAFCIEANALLRKRGYYLVSGAFFLISQGERIQFNIGCLFGKNHPNGKVFSYNGEGFTFANKECGSVSKWVYELLELLMLKHKINVNKLIYKIGNYDEGLCFYPGFRIHPKLR